MQGQTISHYRVLDELGRGGMGVVYRAHDLRLGRDVALKLLPAELAGNPGAIERLRREARVASGLNDPRICTIHDVGEDRGHPFIVMELLEGRSLRSILAEGPLDPGRAVDLALDVAEALQVAHERAVIHRDIKPANIFMTADGRAKVLDFGVAKLVQDRRIAVSLGSSAPTVTRTAPQAPSGTGAGTAAYMSPEQARGEPIDSRSDLFSLGSVLYEMVTGQRAFRGTTPAVVFDGILNRQPERPSRINREVPPVLDRVIEKAMEKEAALRYQDAADLAADLRRVKRALTSGSRALLAARRIPRRRRWLAGSAVALLLAAAAGGLWSRSRPAAPPALTDRDSIVLGEIANRTGETVFDGTLRQALLVQFGQSPYFDIVPEERIVETLRLMNLERDTRMTHDVARETCERIGAAALLDGSITTLGDLYLLTLTASECRTGRVLGQEQMNAARREQVLQALGRMSTSLRGRLGESLASLERFDRPVEDVTTGSLEALRAYTLGIARRAAGAEVESIPFFERAIEQDPDFAMAHTALSTVYGNLGESRRSEEYVRRAYELRDRVSERERLFITFQFYDRITEDQLRAIEALEFWKQSFPRDYRPANALCLAFSRIGQFERAVEAGHEALLRNPDHPFPYSNLAQAYRGLNQFQQAREIAARAVARRFETVPTRRLLFQLDTMAGDSAAAADHLRWAQGRPREFDIIGTQAQIAVYEGRLRDARELYARTIDMARRNGFGEVAAGYAVQLAWAEALYGHRAAARTLVQPLLREQVDPVTHIRAAAVLAISGAPSEAEKLLRDAPDAASLLGSTHTPVAEAAVALARRRPADGIAALQPAAAYELGTVAALAPVYLRALAFAASGEHVRAAAEFRRVLDHRGTDPFSPLLPASQAGLARALAAGGDADGARAASDVLARMLSQADAGIPLFDQRAGR